MVILISQAAGIPKEDLHDLGPVKKPLNHPPAALVGKKYIDESPGIDSMGIWECSPGRWQRTIMQEEFAHFLTGRARFIPDHGEPLEIRAGDSIWFPANSAGTWEIEEDVRKVYVIIDRPTVWSEVISFFKTTLKRWLDASRGGTSAKKGASGNAEPARVWPGIDQQLQQR
jgi:hypothetical protein